MLPEGLSEGNIVLSWENKSSYYPSTRTTIVLLYRLFRITEPKIET